MSRANPRKGRGGAVYVLALTTLLVGVTLALAMLRASGGYFLAEKSRIDKQAAADLAKAGIDYAYWSVHYSGKKLPFTADVTLATGSLHVEAVDDGGREASTMLITSTGTRGRHSNTIKRVTLGLLPYHYVVCENDKIDIADALINTTPVGGIRSNGLIKLDDLLTHVTTGGWATTTISTNGTISPTYPNSPAIVFPDIDLTYYNSIADRTYYSDTTFAFAGIPVGQRIVYVNGRVCVSGTYSGNYTIIATNEISVTGSLLPASSDCYMALISRVRVRVENTAPYVDAILYSHKSDGTARVEVKGVTTVRGSMSGDSFAADQDVTLSGNSGITLAVMKQLRLPGL